MTVAGVSVDVAGLLREWEKADYGELSFRFEPRGGDVLAAMEAVSRVGGILMDRHEDAAADPELDVPFVDVTGPDYSPLGAVFTLENASSPEAFSDWLAELTEELEAAGLAGRVGRMPSIGSVLPPWFNHVPPHQFTAVVYYDVVDPLVYAATPPRWNVSAGVTARLARAIDGWQIADATRALWSAGGGSLLPPSGSDVIEAALYGTRGQCSVHSFVAGPAQYRMVRCKPSGRVAWLLADSSLTWQERLTIAEDALTALPDSTRFGFVQRASKSDTSSWGDLFRRGAYRIGHEYYGLDVVDAARLFDAFIPDARGVMLLTERHLATAADLSDWTLTDLGAGRYLVAAADLEGWYGTDEPSPALLESARRDFAALLLDHDVVETEAQRARSIQDP